MLHSNSDVNPKEPLKLGHCERDGGEAQWIHSSAGGLLSGSAHLNWYDLDCDSTFTCVQKDGAVTNERAVLYKIR